MEDTMKKPLQAKELFNKCGTCSQTFGHLLTREFGYPKDAEVRALDPLAGGLMNQGFQCGMLWGAALGVGSEARRKYKSQEEATAAAITATQFLLESFHDQTDTLECREIIGIDISHLLGMLKFIVKTTFQGRDNNRCYNLAETWAPDAVHAASEGLSKDKMSWTISPKSCASEVVKELGGSEEEQIMVAGFAGGLGLSGKACGALAAAIWFKTLEWCRSNPGKNPPYFNNKEAKKILKAFKKETGSELRCDQISGRSFKNVDEHTEYICNGGCRNLIDLFTQLASDPISH